MKISEIITDKYKLLIPPTVYYDLLADVVEAEAEQKPCDDCVSREAVIEILKDVFDEYEVFLIGVSGQLPIKCVKAIYSLPSVQPNREKHDEEIIKETVESVWGKPPYTELLDKIKAEIERYQADCNLSCSDDANCRICDKITFDTIYRIIDKYRKGQTDADSD